MAKGKSKISFKDALHVHRKEEKHHFDWCSGGLVHWVTPSDEHWGKKEGCRKCKKNGTTDKFKNSLSAQGERLKLAIVFGFSVLLGVLAETVS